MKISTQLLMSFERLRVLVIGDVMLDQQIIGVAERISPEAPVPVIEASHDHFAPGGAANVAANLASLNARVCVAGVVGEDRDGETLAKLLLERGISTAFASDASRPTTTKTRVIAHSQQIVRIDREAKTNIPEPVQSQLLGEIERMLPEIDVVVLSDYLKGVLSDEFTSRIVNLCRAANRATLADPKGSNFSKYEGVTIITPNQKEAFGALRHRLDPPSGIDDAGEMLVDLLPGTAVLITRGPDGMSLFEAGMPAFHVPSTAREVYDVTGAGDTAVAVLALCIAAGRDIRESAEIANHAAGLVVAKFGTATVTLDELRELSQDSAKQKAADFT